MPAPQESLPRSFGRYTLLEHLGQGGMAEVLLARQEGLAGTSRLVAIKRMRGHLALNQSFVQMFLDEVRIVVGLSHPNIGHILDVGRVGDDHFLAMEYIHGRDLAQVLHAAEGLGRRMPIELVVDVGRQVCEALDYAHRRSDLRGQPLNIVHRDVSTDNVILTFDGSIKLVDFGIATAENRITRTRAGTVKGKPPYMAPEQILGRPVDGRADVFSLGTLLYRALTGQHPFLAPTTERTFRRVIQERPPPPAKAVPGLPEALSSAVMRALEKEPEARFADAREMGDALDRILAELGVAPSPRRLGHYVTGLFPAAAAARDRLRQDPMDPQAAVSAFYLGPEDEEDEDDGQTGALTQDLPAEPPRTLELRIAPEEEDAPTEQLAPPAPPRPVVWTPREHWDHLPPAFRRAPVVAAAAVTAAALLLFAGLGVWSCL